MKSFLLSIFLVLTSYGFAQNKKKESKEDPKDLKYQELIADDLEWGSGSIALNDGTELEGMIRYNEKSGIISFEKGKDSRSLNARSVIGFEYFDERTQKQRVYFTFEYEDPKNGAIKPQLFEVLKQFENFAVLLKPNPMEVDERATAYPVSPTGFNPVNPIARSVTVKRDEVIYFVNSQFEILPYLIISHQKTDYYGYWFNHSKTKKKIIDKSLLEEYVGTKDYQILTDYANKNKLNFKSKEDLMKVLDYYEEFLKERKN